MINRKNTCLSMTQSGSVATTNVESARVQK